MRRRTADKPWLERIGKAVELGNQLRAYSLIGMDTPDLIIVGFSTAALAFTFLAYRAETQDRSALFAGLAIGCAVGAFSEWLVF